MRQKCVNSDLSEVNVSDMQPPKRDGALYHVTRITQALFGHCAMLGAQLPKDVTTVD